jgi:hypothetical protein
LNGVGQLGTLYVKSVGCVEKELRCLMIRPAESMAFISRWNTIKKKFSSGKTACFIHPQPAHHPGS